MKLIVRNKWDQLVPELGGREKSLIETAIGQFGYPKKVTFKVMVYEPAYFMLTFSWNNIFLSVSRTQLRVNNGNHPIQLVLDLCNAKPRYPFLLASTGKVTVSQKYEIPEEDFPIPISVLEDILSPWKIVMSSKFDKKHRKFYRIDTTILVVRLTLDTKITLAHWRKSQ